MATLNNLTSGELYFINETDPRTGAPTGFRKIGIVRDTDRSSRDSATRLLQHQVSNPRALTLASVVSTPCVSFLERTMLDQLCTYGFSGEWVLLNEPMFENTMSDTTRKAQELSAASDMLRTSFELREIPSNGIVRPASPTHLDQYLRLKGLVAQESVLKASLKMVKEFFVKALRQKEDVQEYVVLTPVKAHETFDLRIFRTTFPDLFERYTVSDERFSSGSFKLKGPRGGATMDDLRSEELAALVSEAHALVVSDQAYEMFGAIHDRFLRLRSALAVCQWEKTFLDAELRVECGEYLGIEGVCTWDRGYVADEQTDVERFQADFPDEYTRCLRVRARRINFELVPYAKFCFATHGAFP